MQAVTPQRSPPTLASDASAFALPHDFIEVDKGRIAYWRFGSGPDVVLIHGWPIHAATFRKIVPTLAKHFTLHLFDLPGSGQTQWSGRIDFPSHVAALRSAIDSLGLIRYAILAHDSGGVTARLLAADDARVIGLILGNTEIPGHHAPVVRLYAWISRHASLSALVLASMRIGAVRRSPLGFGGIFTNAAYVDGEFGNLFVRPLLASKELAEAQWELFRNLDFAMIDGLAGVHRRILAPVLCIWGTDDPFFPIGKARRMLEQFGGGAELVEIEHAKLFTHEDHPEAFAAHALSFLTRCFAPKGSNSSSVDAVDSAKPGMQQSSSTHQA
jgi:pimeloyl-ACP methyl ester carboxylesterase